MSCSVLGILAGMGPRTTAPFLDRVLDYCRDMLNARWDDEFPDIVVYSLPTPFRPDRPLDEAEMRRALQRGAAALVRGGAEVIAIPCNVAHLFYSTICEAAPVHVLHIVQETIRRLPNDSSARVAVLATRAVAESKLYHRELESRGFQLAELPALQDRADSLIQAFKVNGVSSVTKELWGELRKDLETCGTTHVVVGCTDLSFCRSQASDNPIKILDSMDILAEALVREYQRRENLDSIVTGLPPSGKEGVP